MLARLAKNAMLPQLLGGLMLAVGVLVAGTNAAPLFTSLFVPGGDADCLASTQYDTEDDTIRKCDEEIPCTDPSNDQCKRRSDTFTGETGLTVTATYCSCDDDLGLEGPPTGTCHIWRRHEGNATKPLCTKPTECGNDCHEYDIAGTSPPIKKCKCPSAN